MASTCSVDVFQFHDYRGFLKSYYRQRKSSDYGFSYRTFARVAGLRSPNYLKLVIDGERNLSGNMASKFAQAVGLSGEGADYFCELVAFNQARTGDEKQRHYRRLTGFRGYRKVHQLDAAHAAYHAEWYIPAVRELVARSDFREDALWIARTLLPPIRPAQARAALDVLLELGLLVRDPDGPLRQESQLVQVPSDAMLGHHIANYHRAMLQRAAEAIDLVAPEEREIGALTLCVSEERMHALKTDLQRIREQLLQRYGAEENGRRVVQVNIQMFPLTGKE